MKPSLLNIVIGAALCTIACTGCKTHVPMVSHEPAAYQKKASAAAHWEKMADEISAGLEDHGKRVGKNIYLQPLSEEATAFEVAYWKMIKVKLINNAWKVAANPQDARLQLSFDSQLVSHGARDFYSNPTTVWSLIGLGIVTCFSGDTLGTDRSTGQDLIVTAFLHEDGVPSLGVTQIVYVPPADAPLYSASRDPFGWSVVDRAAFR